ncbi:dehydrogenase E1 and transketolase domain-containing protein 1 [Rhizopogon vinicolor AM-OR11-026]|uniref:Dehydrogenase E1 and transketolase domain-containing protein 1 n=1 Tax=Rhizopogon vinicolor AM-OR11-026 TaxID=1314800 RepID=A0A1B7MNH6_9AGAM|nr:dehydrogenase E1 and transketolase domain-containing protein 1 [Rhizopogon vinicolor AM-OR11-026]
MSWMRKRKYYELHPYSSHPSSEHLRRAYHDESFGFRKPRKFTISDYTSEQLVNRATNAPLLRYADAVRTHGHRAASIDPLDLLRRERVAALNPVRYGLDDPNRAFDVDGILWTGQGNEEWSLNNITSFLNSVYVGRIAYEYMDLPSKTERLWFAKLLESQNGLEPMIVIDAERRKKIHALLAKSEVLDNFLQVKFPNLKRYGLEGGESMLPALDMLFEAASKTGITQLILAMPHRGRLNLLTGLLEYNPTALFHKIKGGCEVEETLGVSGDVLSHLVASPTLQYGEAEGIKVSLQPNPSHLEAVNPVALGKARAKQYSLLRTLSNGKNNQDCMLGDKVMCVQLHGDASFAGQGVVMETLGLSNLPHFTSGGSVHIVVNIGYTTPASSARSSFYCSDVAKMINCPVLHVNGDYPEDVVRAIDIAFKYRNHFRKDIVIDLIVYRRWGHNELDEPSFTQPLMYEKIRSRSSVPRLYEDKLISDGVISPEEAKAVRDSYKASLNAALTDVASYVPPPVRFEGAWEGMVWPASPDACEDDTGVSSTVLKEVGKASVCVPPGFEIHPRLNRHVKSRLGSIESGEGIDWASAEAMAFGSLMLQEGCDVRIAGQDVGRGTFSHRHAMLVDQKTEGVIVPLNHALMEAKGKLELANTSWERPDLLPIWEAQFGDFFNGAQVIIDTFIASSETKWLKQSGIVLLLPHGLDGAGPEHSSSRIERMLQLTNDSYTAQEKHNINMHVVFPTTPAQYFHLLRRQIKRNYRKPLIVAAPKGLLRLAARTSFQPILRDTATFTDPKAVQRVVLLSGKVYYDLAKERAVRNLESRIALVRIEELAPFPFAALSDELAPYADTNKHLEVLWVQEEPRNQGAWRHVKERIEGVLKELGLEGRVVYRGRREDAVPAPGIGKMYGVQQRAVIESAFEGL